MADRMIPALNPITDIDPVNVELVGQVVGETEAKKMTLDDALTSLVQQIGLNVSGALETIVGTSRWYPQRNITLQDVTGFLRLVPAGKATVIDVLKNGVSVFGAGPKVSIAIGQGASSILPVVGISLTPSDYLTVNIVDADGSDLFLRIRYK